MTVRQFAAAVPIAIAMLASSTPALAQAAAESANAGDAALKDEVERLRAEVAAMREEMRAMRSSMGSDRESAQPAAAPASAPPLATVTAEKADPISIGFKGMPEMKSESGWSFKPRGRMQIDAGYLAAPASRSVGQADGRGFTTRIRRAYIGAQGTMPGGFAYRAEVDLAGNSVTWTDLYLSYETGPVTFTVGQHHPFTSMEQLQSDLFLSFNERAAFIGAFNLERRVGVSAGYKKNDLMLNAGVFTDDLSNLTNDGNKSFSVDGRVVWMPKFGETQLHFGASAHYRKLGTLLTGNGSRFRQRPYIATTDIRYIDTGLLTVDKEKHVGLEFAANRGRFRFSGETAWLNANRPGDTDPTFFGGYAELGILLTDDTRNYKNGAFDRISPRRPVGDGGLGALELNLRYDRLDLADGNVDGGTQDGFGAGLAWNPTAYVRFMLNYMHLIYDIPAAQPSFSADTVGMRAQIDF